MTRDSGLLSNGCLRANPLMWDDSTSKSPSGVSLETTEAGTDDVYPSSDDLPVLIGRAELWDSFRPLGFVRRKISLCSLLLGSGQVQRRPLRRQPAQAGFSSPHFFRRSRHPMQPVLDFCRLDSDITRATRHCRQRRSQIRIDEHSLNATEPCYCCNSETL